MSFRFAIALFVVLILFLLLSIIDTETFLTSEMPLKSACAAKTAKSKFYFEKYSAYFV